MMKVLLIWTVFLQSILSAYSSEGSVDEWLNFKRLYGKKYKSQFEEHYRLRVFLENKQLIKEHNKNYENGNVSYRLKMNHFGDLTPEEFNNLMNSHNASKVHSSSFALTFHPAENTYIPESMDWREKGAVTPVKNQGNCGSCWAFSTTGVLEGQHFLKTGQLVSLSEQNLVDCDIWNDGCVGGDVDVAFNYILRNGGVAKEDFYPYEAHQKKCRFKQTDFGASMTGYIKISKNDEESLKVAVATVGPISVGIYAAERSFQFYHSGIYYDKYCTEDKINHSALVVGYGSEEGIDYWLVKNSYGTGFGENGYIRIARNKNNQCGIASEAMYPIVYR